MQRILINKHKLQQTSIETQSIAIADKQILLQIDSFGLSANNITYAVLGDSFGYWGFFPSNNISEQGVMPVWGFATVTESRHPDIEIGKRVFGYFPFASHLLVEPNKISVNGFSDAHPQRKSISPVYDQYVYCDTDPGYSPQNESWQITYRPLFMTAFVLADFVSSTHSNADVVILTSASSKTAYGTAMLLKQNNPNTQVIGLTSPGNIDFVSALNCYDAVYTYNDIAQIKAQQSAVTLDFAGNKQTLVAVQAHLGEANTATLLIGATDVQGRANATDKTQANGDVFFAPSQVKLRQQEWGQVEFFTKYQMAWVHFLTQIKPHIKEVHVVGFENMAHQYESALAGNINPNEMLILKP
ncbi:MAG: DUF2855 family protein [Glaciecola sp.]